jgi:hypothetical protein
MTDAGGPADTPTQSEALLQASSDDDELVEFQQSLESAEPAGHEDVWEAATPPDSDLGGNDSDNTDFVDDLLVTGTGAEQLHLSHEQMQYLEPLSAEDVAAAAAIPLLLKETTALLTKHLSMATETMRTPCTCLFVSYICCT